MKEDGRGKVIDFVTRTLPRNEEGDIEFKDLGMVIEDFSHCEQCKSQMLESAEFLSHRNRTLLGVFTPEEIVTMVNRYLYQFEYQRDSHRKRARRDQELLRDIKAKVKELFGVAWIKATPEQINEAARRVREEKGE